MIMAQLTKAGDIYHYGEKIGEYEKTAFGYCANLGAWCFGGASFQGYDTKSELLTAIRARLKSRVDDIYNFAHPGYYNTDYNSYY